MHPGRMGNNLHQPTLVGAIIHGIFSHKKSMLSCSKRLHIQSTLAILDVVPWCCLVTVSMSCPFAAKQSSQAINEGSDALPRCPLGFGAPAGPALSLLDCCYCKALLHDAVRNPSCNHKFCQFCISRYAIGTAACAFAWALPCA